MVVQTLTMEGLSAELTRASSVHGLLNQPCSLPPKHNHKFGGEIVRALKHGPESFVVHTITDLF